MHLCCYLWSPPPVHVVNSALFSGWLLAWPAGQSKPTSARMPSYYGDIGVFWPASVRARFGCLASSTQDITNATYSHWHCVLLLSYLLTCSGNAPHGVMCMCVHVQVLSVCNGPMFTRVASPRTQLTQSKVILFQPALRLLCNCSTDSVTSQMSLCHCRLSIYWSHAVMLLVTLSGV